MNSLGKRWLLMATSKGRKHKTLNQKLEEVTTVPIARFIGWWNTPEDERKPFDEWKTCCQEIKNLEICKSWLLREDGIKAQQVYNKHMKDYNLSELYKKMLDKAMSGDVQASRWIVDFSNSGYFDESEDEIDSFLSGINIPGLKGGK